MSLFKLRWNGVYWNSREIQIVTSRPIPGVLLGPRLLTQDSLPSLVSLPPGVPFRSPQLGSYYQYTIGSNALGCEEVKMPNTRIKSPF
jgi:hypothetical protein